jgi:uncharacterized repeat protein (TIGR01451 family)
MTDRKKENNMQEPHSASRKMAAVLAVMALVMALLPASVVGQRPEPPMGDPDGGIEPLLDPCLLDAAKYATVATGGGLSEGEVYPGDTIRYTIVVTNPLGSVVPGITLTDPIPDGTSDASIVGFTPGAAWTCVGPDPDLGIICGGNIGPGGVYTVAFTVKADDLLLEGTEILNTATINDGDLGTENLEVSNQLTVASPLRSSVKSASPGVVVVGGTLGYGVTLRNDGPADLTVHMTDTLPALTEYVGPLVCPGCTTAPEYITATATISLTTVVPRDAR